MRIEAFNYHNPYVSFDDQSLCLDKKGIYIIQGANGAGKTSILKEIVFGNRQTVKWNTVEQEKTYLKERRALFAYVSQDAEVPLLTVHEYLTSYDKNIDEDMLRKYLDEFSLSHIKLNEKLRRLSGGERMKLQILRAYMKNTPYILMDEPTNHLDDGAVEDLLRHIETWSVQKTVIIITHDPRLEHLQANRITVEKGQIIQKSNAGEKNEEAIGSIPKTKLFAYGKKILLKKYQLIMHLIFAVILLGFFIWHADRFETGYSQSASPEENLIMAYYAPGMGINDNYVLYEKLTIQQSGYKRISYDDLSDIAGIDGVEKIVTISLDRTFHFENNVINGKKFTTGIPYNVCMGNFIKMLGLQDWFVIEEGTAPADEKKEIALSKDRLKDLYPDTNPEELLGKDIVVDGEQWVLTGIQKYDFTWVSFDYEDSNWFYVYDQATCEDYLQAIASSSEEYPDCAFFFTRDGMEKTVLNTLILQYAENCYDSAEFAHGWKSYYNRQFCKNVIAADIPVMGIAMVLIILIWTISVRDVSHTLNDMRNQMLVSRPVIRGYVWADISFMLTVFAIVSVIGLIIQCHYAQVYLLCFLEALFIELAVSLGNVIYLNR